MKKFPALEEELGLESEGDLRESLFDLIKEESGCDDLSFADDIEPWLGNSVAFAALPGEEEPMPFAVVEVTDQGAAEDGVATLEECGDGEEGEDGGDPPPTTSPATTWSSPRPRRTSTACSPRSRTAAWPTTRPSRPASRRPAAPAS